MVTDNRFTGQKEDGSGLMYYGARYYDPQIGLFVSPDTIVPDAGRVFGYNRTMYVYGNPLVYNDPTGHAGITGNCRCGGGKYDPETQYNSPRYHSGATDQDRQQALHTALNVLGLVPYVDTMEDAMVAYNGCGYACQAGFEEPVGVGWRTVAAAAVVLPFSFRAAKNTFGAGYEIVHAGRKIGTVIEFAESQKGVQKIDMVFNNKNDAMNWATQQLGSGFERMYDSGGKWIGWSNKSGDTVEWGHGDWFTGPGKSAFPHLNYNIKGVKGHLFLEDKIHNNGLWDAFLALWENE